MENYCWEKYRVLVTNKCNYKCSFCHNEGQKKDRVSDAMSFDDFKTFIDIIKDQPLSELNFSGGEPFLNKDICEMIKYACDNLNCDISCATNLSLISNNQIDKLSGTRVKFNIQFPYISSALFQESTGNGNLSKIIDRIEKVKELLGDSPELQELHMFWTPKKPITNQAYEELYRQIDEITGETSRETSR